MRAILLFILLMPSVCKAWYIGVGPNLVFSITSVYNKSNYPELARRGLRSGPVSVPNSLLSVCPVDLFFNSKHFSIGVTYGNYSDATLTGMYVNYILLSKERISPYIGIRAGVATIPLDHSSYVPDLEGKYAGMQVGLIAKAAKHIDIIAEAGYKTGIMYMDGYYNIGYAPSIATTYRYSNVHVMFGLRFCIGRRPKYLVPAEVKKSK